MSVTERLTSTCRIRSTRACIDRIVGKSIPSPANGRLDAVTTSVKRRWCSLLVFVATLVSTAVIICIRDDTDFTISSTGRPSQQNVERSSSLTPRISTDQQRRLAHDVIKVQSAGNFTDRLVAFNAFLSSFRAEELIRRPTVAWQRPTSSKLHVIWGARDDYLDLLSNYSHVTTVVLPWLTTRSGSARAWSYLQDHSNLLIQTYYEWTADNTLCSWIETPGTTRMKYDAVYNRSCNRNINDTVRPLSVRPVFLNAKPIRRGHYWPNDGNWYPAHFYTDTPPYVLFMHIHRDAVITERAHVFTDGLKIIPYACGYNINPSLPSHLDNIPLHNEVFVITQFWGTSVFHRMVEIMPRVALFVGFLKANPEIRILATEAGGRSAELLGIIGLDPSRLVTGVIRAKIVYQPRSTGCGFANVQESQMVSRLYRDYIKRNFPPQSRNRLILIRRSGSRRFSEQQAIEAALKRAAADFNLTYTLFIDNPTPSLNDTMMMFHSAVIVVGPHGAGLSNVFFSQPGTFVVEGVCNLPHVNLCFQRLAHVLGHHWHGVTSRRGCEDIVDVAASHVDAAVRDYLRLWASHRN